MNQNEIKYFAFASIISAANYTIAEEVKQDIIDKFNEQKSTSKNWNDYNWEYILSLVEDREKANKLIKLLKDDTINL